MPRAKPRGHRSYPQASRAFSLNFEDNMKASGIVGWVPMEDHIRLKKEIFETVRTLPKEK